MQATTDHLILKIDDPTTQTAGGILLDKPESTNTGTVVSVGPYVESEDLTPGTRVTYQKHSGLPFKEGGVDYLTVREDAILFVL